MNENKGLGNSLQNTTALLCAPIEVIHTKKGDSNTVLKRGITAKVLSSKSFLYYAHLYKEYTRISDRITVKKVLKSELEAHSLALGGAA